MCKCKLSEQLYRVDVWDKLQTIYAIKIPSKENWKTFEAEHLIKERILKNREGIGQIVMQNKLRVALFVLTIFIPAVLACRLCFARITVARG
jgi:hypothetical protein